MCVVLDYLEGERIEEESEDGREEIEENDVVDPDLINHVKEKIESFSDHDEYNESGVPSFTKMIPFTKN